MLNEQEWNTINNILLELYTIDDIDMLSQKLMYVIRMLIPFTKIFYPAQRRSADYPRQDIFSRDGYPCGGTIYLPLL